MAPDLTGEELGGVLLPAPCLCAAFLLQFVDAARLAPSQPGVQPLHVALPQHRAELLDQSLGDGNLWAAVGEPREVGLLGGGEVVGGLGQEPADLPRGIGPGLRRSRAALFALAAMAVARPAPGATSVATLRRWPV